MAWHDGQSVYSGSVRGLREVYLNPSISPSLPSFCSPVVQPAENFSNTPSHFHALEMATFAFKPQYTYKPTPQRSKSAATRPRPAPKQVNILDKLQQIRSSSTSLSTPRPAATDGDGGYRPGIRGMCQDGDVVSL
jgi:hypothetical protein